MWAAESQQGIGGQAAWLSETQLLTHGGREGERNKNSKQLSFLVDISKRVEAGAKEAQRMKSMEIDIEIVSQDPKPFILYYISRLW